MYMFALGRTRGSIGTGAAHQRAAQGHPDADGAAGWETTYKQGYGGAGAMVKPGSASRRRMDHPRC